MSSDLCLKSWVVSEASKAEDCLPLNELGLYTSTLSLAVVLVLALIIASCTW